MGEGSHQRRAGVGLRVRIPALRQKIKYIFGVYPVRSKYREFMYYVYVLLSKKDYRWYTGYSADLKKRFAEHNNGENESTRKRRPFELIYYEASSDEKDAKAREKFLKTGMGKRYIRNRVKNAFLNPASNGV